MKWFWSILGLLAAVAVVVALQPPQATRTAPSSSADSDDLIEHAIAQPSRPDDRPIEPAASASPNPTTNPTTNPAPQPAPTASAPTATATQALVDDLMTPRAEAASTPLASSGATPAVEPVTGDLLKDGLDRVIPNATVTPGSLIRSPEGTIVADGKYVIRGAGTEQSPYVVPWELLITAMDTYAPRAGLKNIPQRIAFLDGKHVRVEGYVIFFLLEKQAKQCLLTYNQWDGCCIGIPPSAYDAIEVNLASSIPVDRRHGLLFGGVEGILHVAPLVSEGFIYGLYAIDDARLKLEF